MDKEAQEKIEQEMVVTLRKWYSRGTPDIAIMHKLFVKAETYLRELGKLDGEPPLVNTYMVIADNSSHKWAKEVWAHYEQELNWIAQAQRDLCIKHYER